MSRHGVELPHQGQLVAQYRKALKWSQQDLADALGVSLRTVQRLEQTPMIEDIDRRAFLVKLLGIPAALMALENDPAFSRKQVNLVLNDDPMSFLEDVVATRWKMHLMGGPVNVAYGLERVVKEVTHFEQAVRGKAWHQRAMIQLCLVYQLKGSVAGDLMHYEQAFDVYKTSFTIAQELQAVELMAAIRVRQGILFMRQEQPLKAITCLEHGLRLVEGNGYPQLKGNIFMLLSEAHAKAEQSHTCWQMIGLAESTLEQQPLHWERSYRTCNPSAILAHKGVNALLLHDYDRALRLIDKSLKNYNPTQTPAHARFLARKAEAYSGLHMIDECVTTAETAFTLAKSVGASNTIARVNDLHTSLARSSWKNEPGVRRLGALLAIQ
ncbi:MAG TPA: helix-turn-helix domain-containing protein [Ktedonobacteraceae bacterium]|nr:helix-turn-helix domain-containing protein [Ktedonobacteraceae bacterium]